MIFQFSRLIEAVLNTGQPLLVQGVKHEKLVYKK